MNDLFAPLAAVVLLIVWSVFQGRLARRAQPLRLQMADKGEALLASDELPEETRKDVEFMLDSAFARPGMLLFAALVVPFAVGLFYARPKLRDSLEQEYRSMSSDTYQRYAEVRSLHNRLLMANHPLMASIVLFEVTVLLVPLSLLSLAFQRGAPPVAPIDRYVFIDIVEMQERTFMKKLRRQRKELVTC